MYKLTGAAARGNLQEVRDLLDSGVPVDAEYANKTPLVFAASWLKVDVVRLLLERGADVNHGAGTFEGTPLFHACSYSYGQGGRKRQVGEIVRLLIERGADVNALRIRPPFEESPLYAASEHGDIDLVRLLLANGADVEPRNEAPDDGTGNTVNLPLYNACQYHHVEVVEVLLEAGANPSFVTRTVSCAMTGETFGLTSLFTAAGSSRRRSLMQLLLNYVHVDAKTGRHGRTQLHGACLLGNSNVTRGLLQHGADINLADNTGATPLDFALGAIARTSRPSHRQILDSYLPSFWRLLFALTLGRMHRRAELAGHRIAPLIGSFVVGDVLLRKKR